MTITILDERLDESATQHTSLTRIVRVQGQKIRVRIRRDHYQQQSHAVAEVLSTELTWTHLLSEPTNGWWQSTRDARGFSNLADELVERAVRVLA